jgi:hypothetical protein
VGSHGSKEGEREIDFDIIHTGTCIHLLHPSKHHHYRHYNYTPVAVCNAQALLILALPPHDLEAGGRGKTYKAPIGDR